MNQDIEHLLALKKSEQYAEQHAAKHTEQRVAYLAALRLEWKCTGCPAVDQRHNRQAQREPGRAIPDEDQQTEQPTYQQAQMNQAMLLRRSREDPISQRTAPAKLGERYQQANHQTHRRIGLQQWCEQEGRAARENAKDKVKGWA